MACGSCARTFAPFSTRGGRIDSGGDSRKSSVSGLKARPSAAMVFPASFPPIASRIFLTILAFWAALISTAASTDLALTPFSCAIRNRARVSLGKHEPP